jgi:TPR repeat protein
MGVKEDKVAALEWFQKAAEQGLAEAQFGTGLAFLNGRGTDENATEAVKWFKKAAAQGYADAQNELGNCYLEGTGVPKDPIAGVNLLKQAAEAGLPAAQHALGLCYQQGKGITRDYVQAYKWLSLAAAEDDANAAEIKVSLAKVESVLNQDQIVEGQRLAREFKSAEKGAPVASAGAPADSSPTGSVNVTAEDTHAEVFVDGNLVGNAPAKLKLAPGTHAVEVRSPGKKTFHRDLTVGAGAELTVRAELEPE